MKTAMKKRTLCLAYAAALLLGSLALGACHDLLPHRSEGEKLYRKHCAECHGVDGSGNTPRFMGNGWADLLDSNWKLGGDKDSMANTVRNGVFGQMPGYSQKLSDKEIRAVVDHVRVLRGEMARER
jgi:cbb3-type cytochrome c oxidase subunit III